MKTLNFTKKMNVRTFLVLLAALCLSIGSAMAQNIYGRYTGKISAYNALFIDESYSGVSVELANVPDRLRINELDLGNDMVVPSFEFDVTITPSGSDYSLSADEVNIVIPGEIEIPSFGTFTNIPAKIELASGSVSNNVLNLQITITASLKINTFITIPVTVDVNFEGTLNITIGIGETLHATQPNITGYYSITGQPLTREPASGAYIIMYDNGKTEKVFRNND